jgi:hypothetical protein
MAGQLRSAVQLPPFGLFALRQAKHGEILFDECPMFDFLAYGGDEAPACADPAPRSGAVVVRRN